MAAIVKALAALLLTALVTTGLASPTNIKGSEFLQGCRATCRADAQKVGLPHLEGVRKCNCYCDRLWSLTTNSDVDYYVKNGSYSALFLANQRNAFMACFGSN